MGDFIKMRRDLRKIKQYSQIACVAITALSLQACSTNSMLAMDYLPSAAMTLIQNDLHNEHRSH